MTIKRNQRVSHVCGAAAITATAGVFVGLAAEPGSAAVSISIHNESVVAGTTQTVLIPVQASSNAGDVISGFNLPFDYNADGFVDKNGDGVGDLPTGFSLGSPLVQKPVFANTAFDTPQPQISLITYTSGGKTIDGVDGIPTGFASTTSQDLTLTATPTTLFDVAITVASTVPAGTVLPFDIVVPDDPFAPLFDVAGPNSPAVAAPTQGTPVYGYLTVTAASVPEPVTGGLLVGSAAVIGLLGRRRHRDEPSSSL